MSDRKYRETPSVELEAKLRELFKANEGIFEELALRGWSISLSLPYGHLPSFLCINAGFVIERKVTPYQVSRAIEEDSSYREMLR